MPLTNIKSMAAVLCGLAAISFTSTGAHAQESDSRTSTVLERPRPDLDPVGMRLGGFLVFPALAVQETYNDNIFASSGGTGTTDDFITTFVPELLVRSDWNRHRLDLFGRADIDRHADNGRENVEDFRVGFDGRLDVQRDSALFGGVTYRRTHEDRGSVDDVNGIEPVVYDILTTKAAVANQWNRVSLRVEGQYNRLDFNDVAQANPTAIINNDDRDRNEYRATARLGYEIVPEYEAFARFEYNVIDYWTALDDAGFNRNSDGYEVTVGTRVDLTGVMFGDVFVGYLSQAYDDANLPDVDGVSYGGRLTWNVTRLTTVIGRASRLINETTLGGASASFDTAFDLSVDHELLRSLLISGTAGYRKADFRGDPGGREDDYMNFGLSGKYLLNRFLYLTLSYDYLNRDSNVEGSDFTMNRVRLGLRGQL